MPTEDPGQSTGASSPIWIYAALVLLVLLSTGAGLSLSRALVLRSRAAEQAILTWTDRMIRYGELGRLSGEISAAGLALYNTQAPEREVADLVDQIEILEGVLDAGLQGLEAPEALAGNDARLSPWFRRIRAARGKLQAQVGLLTTGLRAGHKNVTAPTMTDMNRGLIDLHAALEGLRQDAADLLRRAQEDQLQRSAALLRHQLTVAGSIGVLVVLLALHGVRLSRRARRYAREREDLLRAVHRRSRDMRLVLDNVGQGLLTLNLDGTLGEERSASVDRWLGAPTPGLRFWEYLAAHAPATARAFALGWEALQDDALPLELYLEQLPRRIDAGAHALRLDYQPILQNGGGGAAEALGQVLVVLTDITDQLRRERAEAEQRQMLAAIERIAQDRTSFVEFGEDGSRLVALVCGPGGGRDLTEVRRALHTLKGNCGLFGLQELARLCHELEDRLAGSSGDLPAADRDRLRSAWQALFVRLSVLLPPAGRRPLEVEPADYDALVEAAERGAPRRELLARIRAWQLQPVRQRLEHWAEQVRGLSARLGKAPVEVHVECGPLRVDPRVYSGFFGSLGHVLRNAVDHGLEDPEERLTAGKPAAGQVTLSAGEEGGPGGASPARLVFSIRDNGRGISWERVAERARERGLPAGRREDLVAALFADGVSTRDEVSEVSGRGVGMGAVRDAVRALHGDIEVDSEAGHGTTFRFRFPIGPGEAPLPRPQRESRRRREKDDVGEVHRDRHEDAPH